MKTKQLIFALALAAACSVGAMAQTGHFNGNILLAQNDAAQSGHQPEKRTLPLDAQREKQALRIFLKRVQEQIVSAAEAMTAIKYECTTSEGEF